MARISRNAALALVLVICLTSFGFVSVSAAPNELLKTPTGIVFTPVTQDSVTINWNAVPEAGHYNIYRRDSGKSNWSVIAQTTGAATTYVDSAVEAKHDYWYKVSAANEFSESEPTKEAFIMLANNEAVLLNKFVAKTKGSRLRLGDLDGDGRTEILVCNTSKQSNYTTNGSVLYVLIAYNLEGEVLWEFTLDPAYDGNGSGVTSTSSDEPVNIYDVDGDGYNEVVAICHPKKDRGTNYDGAYFVILDGRTGKIKLDSKGNECKKPLSGLNVPGLSPTGSGTGSVNSLGDCLAFADLDGRTVNGKKGVRQFVTLKGRYENLTAFEMFNLDGEFTMTYKWRHTTRQPGQTTSQTLTGHMPLAVDLNGDGIDEIISNYTVFKADGSVFWYIPTKIVDANGNPIYIPGTTQQWQASDHVDTIQVGDVDGNPDNGLEVVFGGGGAGVSTFCYSWNGKFIWGNNAAKEPQSVLLADFRTETTGLEVVGLDRRLRNTTTNDYDGMFEISSNGDTLYKEPNNYQGFSSIVIRVSNWTGTYAPLNASFFRNGNKAQTVTPYVNPGEDGSGYIKLGRNPDLDKPPTLYDGYFNPLFELPGVDNRFMAMDLCGDARDELVAYNDNGEIFIYSNGWNDLKDGITGVPKPQSQFMANYSRYPTDIFIPTMATRTPARPSAHNPNNHNVYIDWTPVIGATGYTLYRNGIKLGDFTDVGYLDEGIKPGVEYRYTVSAFDGRNTSPQSMPLIINIVPTPEITKVDVTAQALVETLPTDLKIAVTGYVLEGIDMTAYLEVDGQRLYATPVVGTTPVSASFAMQASSTSPAPVFNALMHIPQAPAAGTYRVIVTGEGVEGFGTVDVSPYDKDIKSANAYIKDGVLNIEFNDKVVLQGVKDTVKIGDTLYRSKVRNENTVVVEGLDTAALERGCKITIYGVMFPHKYPSQHFTFDITLK